MTNTSAAIQALSALGDLSRLADAPASVGEIAIAMPVTRSAVSQHLRVLKAAGLVSETADGARRIYRLDPAGIAAVRDWLDARWAMALGAFGEFADRQMDSEEEQAR